MVDNLMAGLAAFFQISLVGGLVLASPWVIYQLRGFIAPGLHPHEKRVVYRSVPFFVGLFVAGVLFGWFVALPGAVDFMVQFNLRLGFQHQITVSSWVSFALVFPVSFGIAFELPFGMVILSKIGLVSAAGFRRHRRMAILLSAIISAVLTPTVDPIGMMVMFVPMVLLYEAGVGCAWLSERNRGAIGRSAVEPESRNSDDLVASFLVPLVAGQMNRRRDASASVSGI